MAVFFIFKVEVISTGFIIINRRMVFARVSFKNQYNQLWTFNLHH